MSEVVEGREGSVIASTSVGDYEQDSKKTYGNHRAVSIVWCIGYIPVQSNRDEQDGTERGRGKVVGDTEVFHFRVVIWEN